MKNCVNGTEMVDSVRKQIKKIIEEVGKVNLVFPPYKLAGEELKESYRAFASGLARKNLAGYDNLTEKNKRIVELYELALAIREIADDVLKEVKALNQHKNFLVAASIL